MMDQSELIARQAQQIATLEDRCKELAEAMGKIRMGFYCIGGPLNDNVNRYNHKQLVELSQIVCHAEV